MKKTQNKFNSTKQQIHKLIDNFGDNWKTLNINDKLIFTENPQKIYIQNIKLKNTLKQIIYHNKQLNQQLDSIQKKYQQTLNYIDLLTNQIKRLQKQSQIYKYLSQKYQNKTDQSQKLIKILQTQLKKTKQKLLDFFDAKNYKQKKARDIASPIYNKRTLSRNGNSRGNLIKNSSPHTGHIKKSSNYKDTKQSEYFVDNGFNEKKVESEIKNKNIYDIKQSISNQKEEQTMQIQNKLNQLQLNINQIQKNIQQLQKNKSKIIQSKIASFLNQPDQQLGNQSYLQPSTLSDRILADIIQSARLRLKASKIDYYKIQQVQDLYQIVALDVITDQDIQLCFKSYPFYYTNQEYLKQIIQICKKDCLKLNNQINGQTFLKMLYNRIDFYKVLTQEEELQLIDSIYSKIGKKLSKIMNEMNKQKQQNGLISYDVFSRILTDQDLNGAQIQFLVQRIIIESIDLNNLKFKKIQDVLQLYKQDFQDDF